MKRWTRPILAIILGVLVAGYVGMVPAQAAERVVKTETVISYRGYTLVSPMPPIYALSERRAVQSVFLMPRTNAAFTGQN